MCSLRVCALGTVSLISYALMFLAIIRFFDSMSLTTGAVMVASWLATIGLCYLTDRASKQGRSSNDR